MLWGIRRSATILVSGLRSRGAEGAKSQSLEGSKLLDFSVPRGQRPSRAPSSRPASRSTCPTSSSSPSRSPSCHHVRDDPVEGRVSVHGGLHVPADLDHVGRVEAVQPGVPHHHLGQGRSPLHDFQRQDIHPVDGLLGRDVAAAGPDFGSPLTGHHGTFWSISGLLVFGNSHVSYGQHSWLSKTWILYKDASRASNTVPVLFRPMRYSTYMGLIVKEANIS